MRLIDADEMKIKGYMRLTGYTVTNRLIDEVVDSVPTVQIPHWIPVSERLPEKNMACLVAVGKFNFTQMAMYSDLMGTIDHRIFYQGDYGHENFVDITQYVIAWMPLPEPYKAESEIHCNCTDAEIAKSFIEDVEAVKDLLPQESEE